MFDYVEGIMNRAGALSGLPTGFDDLDEMTGGLQPGELIIIAARPSMGKTAFALNIARNAAVDHGKRVAVFSLEMTTRSLIVRLLSSEARDRLLEPAQGIPADGRLPAAPRSRRPALAGEHLDRRLRLRLDPRDQGEEPPPAGRARARPRRRSTISSSPTPTAERNRKDLEIAEISKGLKALAKELVDPGGRALAAESRAGAARP